MARISPTERALEASDRATKALEAIARHEKECGERWAQTGLQLKELQRQVAVHGTRWEKIAWLIISGIGLLLIGQTIKGLF